MAITTDPFEKSNLIQQNNTPTYIKKYKIILSLTLSTSSLFLIRSQLIHISPKSLSHTPSTPWGIRARAPTPLPTPHPPSIKNPTTKCDYYYEYSQQQPHPIIGLSTPNKR